MVHNRSIHSNRRIPLQQRSYLMLRQQREQQVLRRGNEQFVGVRNGRTSQPTVDLSGI